MELTRAATDVTSALRNTDTRTVPVPNPQVPDAHPR